MLQPFCEILRAVIMLARGGKYIFPMRRREKFALDPLSTIDTATITSRRVTIISDSRFAVSSSMDIYSTLFAWIISARGSLFSLLFAPASFSSCFELLYSLSVSWWEKNGACWGLDERGNEGFRLLVGCIDDTCRGVFDYFMARFVQDGNGFTLPVTTCSFIRLFWVIIS